MRFSEPAHAMTGDLASNPAQGSIGHTSPPNPISTKHAAYPAPLSFLDRAGILPSTEDTETAVREGMSSM
jgi:hypothetical protein